MKRWQRSTVALGLSLSGVSLAAGASPAASSQPAATTLAAVALRTEYKENPVGIDARQPRLSWQLRSDARGVSQSAYQVRVALSEPDVRPGRRRART